ncbi:MAG: hypothetical protein DRJ62_03820 [Thermoprotei archaeon]|nr:MAG: hypothetical protein DRJ62_03820 [Thermoprotei archaeon]
MAISDRGACHLHSIPLGLEIGGHLNRFTVEGKAFIALLFILTV